MILPAPTISPLTKPQKRAAVGPVAGMSIWLKANAIVGLSDGDPVATWVDSSGNGNNAVQASGAAQPTYRTGILNGLPVVRFNGAGNKMAAPITATATQTVFVAARKRTTSGANEGLVEYGNISTIFCNAAYGVAWQWYGDSVVSFGGDMRNWAVLSLKFDSTASLSMYLNGVLAATTNPNDQYASATSLRIGEYEGGTPDVDIAELLIYPSALSDADRASVESYLIAKYAL